MGGVGVWEVSWDGRWGGEGGKCEWVEVGAWNAKKKNTLN